MRKSGWKEWGKNSDNSLQTKQIGRDFSLSLSLKVPLTEGVSTIDKCNFWLDANWILLSKKLQFKAFGDIIRSKLTVVWKSLPQHYIARQYNFIHDQLRNVFVLEC